jgi:hypothetical protein
MDILVIGDTRCGKSKSAESIMAYTRLGEMTRGENASFAGLVGGLQQLSKNSKWDIVWGKIPLNDGKLLIIDEMSSLSENDIGNMSALRSSGVAEVTKIQSGATRSRTRLVWMSNCRSDRKIGQYQHGIHAVKDLVGRPEDVARFDFAIAVATDDVPASVVNARREPQEFPDDWRAMNCLIRWAWSLRPSQIFFDDGAIDAVLDLAAKQATDYSNEIPLVEPNEQRIKLARVAAAVAVRCFSEYEGNLYVCKEHVEYANLFMRRCFDSKAMGYKEFSTVKTEFMGNFSKHQSDLCMCLKRFASEDGIRVLAGANFFNMSDLEAIFDIPRPEARSLISLLIKTGAVVRKGAQGYEKTTYGMRLLEAIGGQI